jgi:hypothetical protein
VVRTFSSKISTATTKSFFKLSRKALGTESSLGINFTCIGLLPTISTLADPFIPACVALKRRDEIAKKLGITLQGGWANMPNHTMYMVCDAPNAHVVNQMAMELGLMDWNTIVISPVVTFDEVQKVLRARKS